MRTCFKKLFLAFIVLISLSTILSPILTPHSVHAADSSVCNSSTDEAVKEAAGCNGNEDLVGNIIINLLYVVIFVAGVISVIYIVVGGVKYMSSKGDVNATQSARKTILYAMIGLIVTSLAFVIVNFTIGIIYSDGNGGSTVEPGNQSGANLNSNDEIKRVTLVTKKDVLMGKNEKLRPHITPVWLSDSALTWTSSDPSIVSVDSKGEITPKKEGTATITVTTENGKSASTEITVTKPIEPERVTLTPSTVNVVKDKTANVKATVFPTNANNKHVTWSSDNKTIAAINDRGQITGKKEGTTTITAKTENGKTATATVKVTDGEGGVIQINQSLLKGLDKYYQTNYMSDSVSCYSSYGGITCGGSAYMAARYIVTRKDTNYHDFIQEACNNGVFMPSSSTINVHRIAGNNKSFYENKYGVKLRQIANSWSASVTELKKGHAIIYLVPPPPEPEKWKQQNGGWVFTYAGHYINGVSYREKNGGEIYIWSPVPGAGRNIGDCSKGECWYNKTLFERNITILGSEAWAVEKK